MTGHFKSDLPCSFVELGSVDLKLGECCTKEAHKYKYTKYNFQSQRKNWMHPNNIECYVKVSNNIIIMIILSLYTLVETNGALSPSILTSGR